MRRPWRRRRQCLSSRNRSRKNQNVSISSDSVYDYVAYDPVKTTSSRSWKQKCKNQPIARPRVEHCYWFILPPLFATSTMQFSLDRKRRSHNKQNQCSASDSVGLIFARSYRSTLLISTTPPTIYDSVASGSSLY